MKILSKISLIILTILVLGLITIAILNNYFKKDTQTVSTLKIDNNDLIYQIMTDRFFDGDNTNNQNTNKDDLKAYHGGDFQGIINKLDYIKKLGFTTIWISPVQDNEGYGYHGYWKNDFYKTEEHFGSLDKLKELVNSAHGKGLKVVFDLVLNHTGGQSKFATDSNYANWFHKEDTITDWNDQSQIENGKLAGLPDLNQENPEVRKYLLDMAKWWIKETGIDGYRLDAVRHIPKDFWEDITKQIKAEYPNFYFIGEVFDGNAEYITQYQKAGIDGITDFPVYYAINDVLARHKPATKLKEAIEKSNIYRNRSLMGTFIDNHDAPRLVGQLTRYKEESMKQALTFMMTYTGIPVMYYGTEVLLDGGSDPDNRRDMDFTKKSNITSFVKKLTKIRKTNDSLTKGDIRVIIADSNSICFTRTYNQETIFVVFNFSAEDKRIEIDIPSDIIRKEGTYVDLLNNKKIRAKASKLELNMGAKEVYILK